MDISSLGSSVAALRSTGSTSVEAEETKQSESNATQSQVSQEAQNSTVPPVQASSELGGEEGSVVNQDNSGSANAQTPKSRSGVQVDLLA
jgi:hypothetical protein